MAKELAVFTRPSPSKLMTAVPNALFSALLRSPLHGIISKRCVLLSFRGYKSRKKYTFPVGYFRLEGNIVTVIPLHNWWRNLRGNVPVMVWLKGRKYQATANTFHGDETTVYELQDLIGSSSNLLRVCGVERNAQGQPEPESLRQVAQSLVLARLQLTMPAKSDL